MYSFWKRKEDLEAIQIKELTKAFGSFVAVDRLSLAIPKGTIFGFLGPNGSGKTTTVRILCGILSPTAGKAAVLGFDSHQEADKVKKRIGYVSQFFSLYRDLTVEENLLFYSSVYNATSTKRRAEVLRRCRLENIARSLVRNLSPGKRQWLALACAVVHEPEVLFLDEPTSGMDPFERRDFWDELHYLLSKGVTIFITTHLLDEAERCHQVGFIHLGRLLASGSPEEVKQLLPGKIFSIQASNVRALLQIIREKSWVEDAYLYGNRLRVHLSSPEGEKELGEMLKERDFLMERIHFSLEDSFVYLARKGGLER